MHRFRPSLTALVPEGWLARESVELVSTEDRAYVVASASAVSPDTTLESYAEEYGQQLSERYPEYEEVGLEQVTLPDGREALYRNFRWTPPDAETVAELQMYVVENDRGILATASAPADGFGKLEPRLRALMSSVSLGSPAPGGGLVRRDGTPRSRTYDAFEAGQLSTTPASAFGLAETASSGNGESDPEDVAGAWEGARTEWQKAGEAL